MKEMEGWCSVLQVSAHATGYHNSPEICDLAPIKPSHVGDVRNVKKHRDRTFLTVTTLVTTLDFPEAISV